MTIIGQSLSRIYLWIVLLASVGIGCQSNHVSSGFVRISASQSGLDFQNKLDPTDSINILTNESFYNGAGVAVADFNNDSLPDVFFAGNTVPNALYLNTGKLRFRNVTDSAGIAAPERWCKGVSVVDINADGWLDVYVSASFHKQPDRRRNLLFVNQRAPVGAAPKFIEMAAAYGLDDTTHSTQAAFFDYDRDGDLDMYLLVNSLSGGEYPNTYRPIVKDGNSSSVDRLYRNDWDSSLNHPRFTNVSREAGILQEGFGHGVTITDINQDGWPDVYVTNDYIQNDLLWINQKNGTFQEQLGRYFKHTSNNGMGNEVADVNNDGRPDVIALDMLPQDNYRLKTMTNPFSYVVYQNNDYYGYHYEYMRNTLQLNLGPQPLEGDSLGNPVFAEIAYHAGVSATDWSWTPLLFDVDNDGWRDMIITNGFPRDMTDHDFIAYRQEAYLAGKKDKLLEQLPEVRIRNYGFKNLRDGRFEEQSLAWGLTEKGFTHGAAYADLDRDGDLDVIANQMNGEALLYENSFISPDTSRYVVLELKQAGTNPRAHGAVVRLFAGGVQQYAEVQPARGFLSSTEHRLFFGIGLSTQVDSVWVQWPDGKQQRFGSLAMRTTHALVRDEQHLGNSVAPTLDYRESWLQEVTRARGFDFVHTETDFIDFTVQKLIPHKLSEYGPALAVADLDGNGLDDVVIGGSMGQWASVLYQQASGRFSKKSIAPPSAGTKRSEDMGVLAADWDNDGDVDVLIASGSAEIGPGNPDAFRAAYTDQCWMNTGAGNFSLWPRALPVNLDSKSAFRAADIDKDGDLDLLVTGRSVPGRYPLPSNSYIYRNDSKPGDIRFTDVTKVVAPELQQIGMVCDALWTDLDGDNQLDILLAGEFLAPTWLRNDKGRFRKQPMEGVDALPGWYNSIAAADFDADGDMDYVFGNLGTNSFLQASPQEPFSIYVNDVNGDGFMDAIPSLFLYDQLDGKRTEFPLPARDELIKEVIQMKGRFQTYKDYARAGINTVLTDAERTDARILRATEFRSLLLRNEGGGKFVPLPLPSPAQWAPVYGMQATDVNQDGYPDLLLVGNDFGTEVTIGRYDALNGWLLLNDTKGGWQLQSLAQAGWYVPGNAKALVQFNGGNDSRLYAASQNRGPAKLFQSRKSMPSVRIPFDVQYAELTMLSGKKRKVEVYVGQGFLSQSARILELAGVKSYRLITFTGKSTDHVVNTQ
jgi:hypothetical protein